MGAAVSGERRPTSLKSHIEIMHEIGRPITISGMDIENGPDDSAFSKATRKFVQVDGVGRAYQVGSGIQNITRESREAALSDLDGVGELDMIIAFYQTFLVELKEVLPEGPLPDEFQPIQDYIDSSPRWRENINRYYGIEKSFVKEILIRLPFDGRLHPDGEWEADREDDILPCLLELRHAFQKGQGILATSNEKYKKILAMKKVQEATNPHASALALFLQDAENQVLKVMADEVGAKGARILGYVFDGLYIMCANEEVLKMLFHDVAPLVFVKTGIRIALKSVKGDVMDTFSQPQADRKRLADASYNSPSPKRRATGEHEP